MELASREVNTTILSGRMKEIPFALHLTEKEFSPTDSGKWRESTTKAFVGEIPHKSHNLSHKFHNCIKIEKNSIAETYILPPAHWA